MSQVLVLSLIGFVGGFTSGLLGVGGAILMVPMLLFLPPLLGAPALDMQVVAAITIVQVFFSALSGVAVHWRGRRVHPRVVLYTGGASAAAAFLGGWLSQYVAAESLLLLFALLAAVATGMLFIPRPGADAELTPEEVPVPVVRAVGMGTLVGGFGGLVGAPGGFLYMPLMIYVLHVPTRLAVGSSLAVVLLASLFGAAGKLASGQVPLLLAGALVLGAVPGAQLGGYLSGRVHPRLLRAMVAVIISAATLRMWEAVLS